MSNNFNRHWFSLFAIAVATLVSPFPSDQGCPNFEPGPVDVIQFQNAVFRIEDGKPEDIGTAFLIDARNGYLLTAMHVVKNALSDPKIKLTGRSPLIPTSLDLMVVDSSPERDLALLQLKKPDERVSSIVPLDIALRVPRVGATLTAMGYPTTFGNETNTGVRSQPAFVTTIAEDGDIEVRQVAIGGSSGGPLIDASGMVVGICRHETGLGESIARYIMTSQAEPLLNKIPETDRVKQIDNEVRNRTVTPLALSPLLQKFPNNASNMELYSWARHIVGMRSAYSGSSSYFICPIIPAMMHRRLDDPVVWLGTFAQTQDFSNASLAVSERQVSLGNASDALVTLSKAAPYVLQSGDRLAKARSFYVQGLSEAKLEMFDAATDSLSKAAEESANLPAERELKANISSARARVFIQSVDSVDIVKHEVAPRGQYERAVALYGQAENNLKALGPTEELASVYRESGLLLAKLSKFEQALERLMLASSTYTILGNFNGVADTEYQIAGVESEANNQRAAIDHLRSSLWANPSGRHANDIRAVLSAQGFRDKDFPGLQAGKRECPDCTPEEWIVTEARFVDHGDYVFETDPPCDQRMPNTVEELNTSLAQFAGPALSNFAGPTTSLIRGRLNQQGGDIARLLDQDRRAACKLVCVVYPRDAQIKRVELFAAEYDQPARECPPDQNGEFSCSIGWSKWQKPLNVVTESSALLCGVFKNWSHDRNRVATMSVSFKPRTGWQPIVGH